MNLMFLAVFVAFVANSLAQKNEICYDFPFEDGSGSFTCYAVLPRWSYVSVFNGCADFTYGGCGGNKNNFDSKKECEDTCVE